MIAYLEGSFTLTSPAAIIVDVQGVGYDVNISLYTYDKIKSLQKGRLLIHYKVSETEHSLFGFFDEVEKKLFQQLISVSGVGAATARMMLSSLSPAELASAIANADEKTISRAKGIGAKTAQRIILDLKDKVQKGDNVQAGGFAMPQNNLQTDALNALVSLGIARNTAHEAVKKVMTTAPDVADVQAIIKLALKNL